jgi:hypothetical protein
LKWKFLKKFNSFSLFFLPINKKTSKVGTIRNLKTVSSLAVSQKSVREKDGERYSLSPLLLSINYSVLFFFFLLQLLLSAKSSERERKRLKKIEKDPFSPFPLVY